MTQANVLEHEGVKYRKVEREAVEGDKIVANKRNYDITRGRIYEVTRIHRKGSPDRIGVCFDDDDGDSRAFWLREDYETLEPLPTATMPKLTDAKPGDIVRVIDVNDSEEIGYSNGDTFEVESVWDNLLGVNVKDSESSFGLYAEEFEVVREESIAESFFEDVKAGLEQAIDLVNHPDHYNAGRFEVIDVIEDITKSAAAKGANGFETYMLGNVVKYIARYRHKNGAQDLRKAAWYLQRMIDEVEND